MLLCNIYTKSRLKSHMSCSFCMVLQCQDFKDEVIYDHYQVPGVWEDEATNQNHGLFTDFTMV